MGGVMVVVSNWYCPKCKKIIASGDMFMESRRHKECGEKVDWVRQKLEHTLINVK